LGTPLRTAETALDGNVWRERERETETHREREREREREKFIDNHR
jgi:hypothetical protein